MRYLHWWHGNPAGAAQSLSSHLSPAVIAGRENEQRQFELALAEGPGNPWRTALISGSRGRRGGDGFHRHELIYRELIVAHSRGKVQFALPYMAEYLNALIR
ncbi:hypothetical protein [Corynebacterium mastitidis]|uniref:hypothetical protein n=1 Tax=Corynebacterium mastitidis TaxID=161890 RepID=UPI00254F8A25|nr:hypothetical protein [Corynebacterium mastitidis]MDK8449943.1 hypothetical protein [Corynebacterium mastitidis]